MAIIIMNRQLCNFYPTVTIANSYIASYIVWYAVCNKNTLIFRSPPNVQGLLLSLQGLLVTLQGFLLRKFYEDSSSVSKALIRTPRSLQGLLLTSEDFTKALSKIHNFKCSATVLRRCAR